MAKLYIDYNSVNSKTGDLAFYIQKYEKCLNESCYNLQKTDYCWHDKNQEAFVNSVKKLKYDAYEHIKLLRKYALIINTFYNNVKNTIINNFDYNYVTTISYNTDYANKAIEALNRVIKRLDWINREMPSCIVPSDYPYKKVIDNITGATFPYCNDVVRFNSKIASVNSKILSHLNSFYYDFINLKPVIIEKNRLSHQYQLFTPDLKEINIEEVDSVKAKNYEKADINIDDKLINPDVEKNKKSDDELDQINMNNNYTDLVLDNETARDYVQSPININNNYSDSDEQKYYASKNTVGTTNFDKININVQSDIQHANNNDISTINFEKINPDINSNDQNVLNKDISIENIQSFNSIDVDNASASEIKTSIDNFQSAKNLDVDNASASEIKTSIDNLQSAKNLDVDNVTNL